MYKDFNDWEEYSGFSEGSGSSDQHWIVNKKTNQEGLFKFPKDIGTTDHISEKISSDIAKLINVKCANIDLGIYENRLGMISYRINSDDESLVHGIELISNKYINYDIDEWKDTESGECYSLHMIMESLEKYELDKEFLKIVIFDFIIGNSDRHTQNWAIIRKNKKVKICPLYDNASSLCSYESMAKLEQCLGRDKNRFNSLVDSKSRTLIRIDRYELGNKKGPKQSDMVRHVKEMYYDDTINFVEIIKQELTEEVIDILVNKYERYLGITKAKVLKMYLKAKVKLLLEIYNIEIMGGGI